MTIVVVVLLGAGVLLIASALDNTPIVQTFQKILNGNAIDWSGTNSTGGSIKIIPPGAGKTPLCPLGSSYQLRPGETSCGPGYAPLGNDKTICVCIAANKLQ